MDASEPGPRAAKSSSFPVEPSLCCDVAQLPALNDLNSWMDDELARLVERFQAFETGASRKNFAAACSPR